MEWEPRAQRPAYASRTMPRLALRNAELLQSLAIAISIIVGYGLVLLRDDVLPARFLADGVLIRDIARGIATADSSYTNTANAYAALGLQNHPLVAYLLGYSLAASAIVIVWSRCRAFHGGGAMTLMACIALALSAVYLGYYSKDVFVLPITIAVLVLKPSRISGVILAATMVMYAIWFRGYWFFVGVLFVAFWLILPKVRGIALLLVGAVATACSSAAIVVVLGIPGDAYRDRVNEYRTDVGTLIEPFVTWPDPIGGIVNNVMAYFTLIFPVPVLLNGGVYYVAVAITISAIWFLFLRAISSSISRTDPFVRRAAALVMAFVSTQALFEPDYGSALRHLTPLLPLMLFCVWQGFPSARTSSLLMLDERRTARS